MSQVLSPAQLKRLSEHKYSSEGQSMSEPYMQIFWRWLVEQVPLWWAPNAITLFGLLVNIATTFILFIYSPDALHEPPKWAFLLTALGLFLYQSLDAIDGKQARRTGNATHLGELFDHGCDAVSTVFVSMGACIALRLGTSPPWLFFEVFSGIFLFYCAHWQTYCTGTLKFGKFDVTEAQFLIMILYTLTGIWGHALWEFEIPILGALKFLPIYFSIGAAIVTSKMYFSIIFMQGGVGKNGSTVAATSVLSPGFPLGLTIALAIMIMSQSPTHVYEDNPILYLLLFGVVSAKVTNKLVVAHMTKSEMDILDTVFISPGILFLNQYFNCPFNETLLLWIALVVGSFDLLRYSTLVCLQICSYLNIYCFNITSTPLDTANGSKAPQDYKGPVTRSASKNPDKTN